MLNKYLAVLAVSALFTMASAQEINWDRTFQQPQNLGEITGITAPLQTPAPECVKVTDKNAQIPAPKKKVVHLEDTLNNFTAQLTVSVSYGQEGVSIYTITNKKSPGSPRETVKVLVRNENTPVEVEGAGPDPMTPREILERHNADIEKLLLSGKLILLGGQITWTIEPRFPPTKMEMALVMFMVYDWFYYG